MLNIFFLRLPGPCFMKSLAENEIVFVFCCFIYIYSDKCIYCFTVAFILHVQIYRMLSNFSQGARRLATFNCEISQLKVVTIRNCHN